MTLTPLARALTILARGESLDEDLAAAVFGALMRGDGTPAQVGALLMGLRVKGETPAEVAGAARAMRAEMVSVPADLPHLVDTCGTGGGSVTTFNISTVAAFVAVGAGAAVAKHGNRSYTSKCGSADLFEALGIRITLDADAAGRVLRATRIAFLFAPQFHPAMRHVIPVRRDLGVASVMNLLGPLANPAGVRRQVVGVADRDRAPLMAAALARLGAEHALVVHGRIGMDEIAPVGPTDVWEVRGGDVREWTIDPTEHGVHLDDVGALAGGDPPANARRALGLLDDPSADIPGADAVALNAGAAIWVSGLADSLGDGVRRARRALADGSARRALDALRRESPSTSG